jgi:two-component system CheB/CheR fusion protein
MRSYTGADGRNVTLDGPNVMLAPKAATTTGMVLYELTTNAVKYGALQQAGGRISVNWGVEPNGDGTTLRLDWTETTAAPVLGALTPGFGTSFIRRSIEYELQGTTTLDLEHTGLRCRIEFVLRDESEPSGAEA